MRMLAFLERDRTFTEPIIWITTSVMVAIHIGAVAALFMFSWRAFTLAMVLCWVAGSLVQAWDTIVFLRIEVTRPPSGPNIF